MEAYCVKCKEKREMKDPFPTFTSAGAPMTRGVCPVCGTNLVKMGNTPEHGLSTREGKVLTGNSPTQRAS